MSEPPDSFQVVNALTNGGAFLVLVFAVVMAIRYMPKMLAGLLAQHDKMLTTFAENQKAERDACDERFKELVQEMRRGFDIIERDKP